MSAPSKTEVLIVGGGPTGLVMSALLSRFGISNVVAEKRDDMGTEPKAHLIRHRTMEIFDLLGLGGAVRAAQPRLSMDFVTWCSTLAGPEIGRLDLRSSRPDGRTPWVNLSQVALQPILHERAAREPSATILKGTECTELRQRQDGVIASLTSANGTAEIHARYAVAADGAGSPTRTALGISMDGVGHMGKFHMIHFRADLTPWIMERQGSVFWIFNPDALGTLIVHDPEASHVFMTPVFGMEGEEDTLPQRLEKALGTNIPFEILSAKIWVAHKQIATQYRKGRVFLVGDAAHRFPPTGGLGLNTGVAEAHNLAWKLALVLKGKAAPALLDTYEAECRPAAQANADDSLANMDRLATIGEALGRPRSLPELEIRLTEMTAEGRAALQAAIEMQRRHFIWDGALPGFDPRTGKARLDRRPTASDAFVLRGPANDPWSEWAAQLSAELGVDVGFEQTDASAPDFENTEMPSADKAVLVRPDGVVEWREEDNAMSGYADMKKAAERVLGGELAAQEEAPAVSSLGYLGFEVPDLEPWRNFFHDVVGLMPAESEPDGTLGFRTDEYEHRFIVEQGPANDIAFAGWEVKDAGALARMRAHVEAAGLPVTVGDAELAARRKVEGLIYFADPNGVRMEIFWGPAIADAPFHSALVPDGFVTGECGLGHLVFGAKDWQETFDFYTQVLGFKLSDYIREELAPGLKVHVTFLHCNPRHHTLAFVPIEFPTRLQHFMIEAKTMSGVGRAFDRFREKGVPISMGLGHHPNDRGLSFYAKAPNGIEIEFGWGPVRIEDEESWQPRTYSKLSDWGHKPDTPPRAA